MAFRPLPPLRPLEPGAARSFTREEWLDLVAYSTKNIFDMANHLAGIAEHRRGGDESTEVSVERLLDPDRDLLVTVLDKAMVAIERLQAAL